MGLIRILVLVGLAIVAYSIFRRFIAMPGRNENPNRADDRLGRLVQDPQCGVWVDGKEAVRRKVPGGELFFCSKECAQAHLEGEQEQKSQQDEEKNQDPPGA